ncbi:MAG TPA: hypothetical protein VHT73_18055 [Thermodesulfobacteriota bacterium]|nr:hypothetical protein [Thermodesulfobacteriota bacterium]
MKKLIAIGTLGLALSFPSLSFASDYMGWLPTKPIVKSEVRKEIKGGTVERDFTSFYISPKEANPAASLRADRKSDDDKDYTVVFGVRIPVSPRT